MLQFIKDLFEALFNNPDPKPAKRDESAAVEMIETWEGLRLKAYLDTGGVWTIGYGHTKTARPGMVISSSEAERLLRQDMQWAREDVDRLVAVELNDNQRSALISFVYNIGTTQFAGSTLLRKLNEGDYAGAANEFKRWKFDNGRVIKGLINRRADEEELFRS